MDRTQLLQHFDTLAETPDAVEKLRKLVLDLAVQGRLASQDTNDESVSKLLTRIRTAMESFNKAGRSKPSNGRDETPLEVPKTWAWVRFGDIVRIRTGKLDANAAVEGGDYPFFTCSQTPSRIATYSFDTSAVLLAGNGDFNLKYHVGKFDAYQRTYVIEPLEWDLRFCFTLMSSQIRRITENNRGSAIPYLKLGDISEVFVPLPPLAEQRRIVAKVEELLALCEELEARQTAARERRTRLVRSALDHLTTAKEESDFKKHSSFVLRHSDLIFDTVPTLRLLICQLGIQGRLVSQNDGEGKAEQIPDEIDSIRKKLLREKQIKKAPVVEQVPDSERPFFLPKNWVWTQLGYLCLQVSDGPHFSPKYVSKDEGVPFLSGRNIKAAGFDLSDVKYVSKPDHAEFCKRVKPKLGDILYTKGGTTGVARVNDLPFEFSVWVHVAVLRLPTEVVSPDYVALALNSAHCYEQSQRYTHGMANRDLGLTRMVNITIPLPPLAEQQRIVAKVDELLRWCDALEARLTAAQTTATHLLDATLHQILAA